jgi:hypothetical protein
MPLGCYECAARACRHCRHRGRPAQRRLRRHTCAVRSAVVTSGALAIITWTRCCASCKLCRNQGRSAWLVRATIHAPRIRMGPGYAEQRHPVSLLYEALVLVLAPGRSSVERSQVFDRPRGRPVELRLLSLRAVSPSASGRLARANWPGERADAVAEAIPAALEVFLPGCVPTRELGRGGVDLARGPPWPGVGEWLWRCARTIDGQQTLTPALDTGCLGRDPSLEHQRWVTKGVAAAAVRDLGFCLGRPTPGKSTPRSRRCASRAQAGARSEDARHATMSQSAHQRRSFRGEAMPAT